MKVGTQLQFVMKDGSTRPLIVIAAWTETCVNGVLLFDGLNDADNFPEGSVGGMVTLPNTGAHGVTIGGLHSAWVTSVKVDDSHEPGTCLPSSELSLQEITKLIEAHTENVKAFVEKALNIYKRRLSGEPVTRSEVAEEQNQAQLPESSRIGGYTPKQPGSDGPTVSDPANEGAVEDHGDAVAAAVAST